MSRTWEAVRPPGFTFFFGIYVARLWHDLVLVCPGRMEGWLLCRGAAVAMVTSGRGGATSVAIFARTGIEFDVIIQKKLISTYRYPSL